jgi:hypothetical protein
MYPYPIQIECEAKAHIRISEAHMSVSCRSACMYIEDEDARGARAHKYRERADVRYEGTSRPRRARRLHAPPPPSSSALLLRGRDDRDDH